jgi:hypothetical protein
MKYMRQLITTLAAAAALLPALANAEIPALQAERWVNSPALTPAALKGKVVLVDFWEYTCINWIRSSPYTKALDRDYARYGLTVIGVHAPEFEFGKQAANIDRGIRDHQLTYPVALDNKFTVWQAFRNDAWPAKYLFDAQGTLVRRWVGEGSYDEIEAEVRRLLMAAHPDITLPDTSREAKAFARSGQPSYAGITGETYVGGDQREPGAFQLEGDWLTKGQYIELRKAGGKIVMPFMGSEANLVVQPPPSGKGALTVLLDGKPVSAARGADVGEDGVARFDRSGMLRLVNGAGKGNHVLTLVSSEPGFRAYVFTFVP